MRRWRALVGFTAVFLAYVASTQVIVRPAAQTSEDPAPRTLDEFRAAVTTILNEAHVPGAAIALVRYDGIEWVGGFGMADQARQIPVTADTHFRVGSISKTFVAMSLVQMAQEGLLTLDDLVSDIVPDVAIDNPWEVTTPIRVVHLLQHTAGFDDMHFAEMYNFSEPPDLPLTEALRRAPRSRRVRWQPGTRMSYSNPGYGVAGLIVEKIAEQPYEDYIRTHIFEPLGMTTSSFRQRPDDEATMARGYSGPGLQPSAFPQIYLRPAGNLHTSARELATFVQMLLNWGALGNIFIVDPEYLGNMERPRTTVASTAGLRNGYGSGIMTWIDLPYPMLGHGGGIEGFVSAYGYSPARDVGFVVLLNRDDARATLNRIAALATRYLKDDLEVPVAPDAVPSAEVLRSYEGYYQEANPRNQLFAFTLWLGGGFRISALDNGLQVTPVFGAPTTLVPVSDSLFRRELQTQATRVFARTGAGTNVMVATVTGGEIYAERVPRWRVEIVRWPVLIASAVLLTPLVALVAWLVHMRRAKPEVFWTLKTLLVLIPLVLAVPLAGLFSTPVARWGARSTVTIAMFLGTLAFPTLAIAGLIFANGARRRQASRWLVIYALLVAVSTLIVSAFLASFGLIGIRLWTY
jgi:CubicO group peptidase (beta-lactamase class C family)